MAERPEGRKRQPGADHRRPKAAIDRTAEWHSMIFWIISYMPVGVLFALILNSIAPLLIAICLGYLTTQSLNS